MSVVCSTKKAPPLQEAAAARAPAFSSSASSSAASFSSSSVESSDMQYEPYPVDPDAPPVVQQLGAALLENETAMWQRELINALPEEQLDALAEKDSAVRKANKKTTGMESQSFPLKLHTMLTDAELEGFTDVVSWQGDGRSFKVHQPSEFSKSVMGRYFRQTKYKSFQRQLNLYGFSRIHHGPNKGGYEHRFFSKERPSLLDAMTRQKLQTAKGQIKGVPKLLKFCTTKKIISETVAVKQHKREPSDITMELFNASMDLSVLDICDKAHELADKIISNAGIKKEEGHEVEETELLQNFLLDGDDTRPQRHRRNSSVFDGIDEDPVFRALLQDSFMTIGEDDLVASPIGNEDISEMFSRDQAIPEGRAFAPGLERVAESPVSSVGEASSVEKSPPPKAHNEHSFPWKLHDMLADAEREGFQHVVSWALDGTVFCVNDQEEFVGKIMPLYFDQTKYESFRRQLNLYGFTRIVRGPYRGNYMHKFFLKNERALCANIHRNVPPRQSKAKRAPKEELVDIIQLKDLVV